MPRHVLSSLPSFDLFALEFVGAKKLAKRRCSSKFCGLALINILLFLP